jgi:hypothetical protein
MARELDFSKGGRGPVLPSTGKTRITIWIDDDILDAFRERSDAEGRGYQTAMNEALRRSLDVGARQDDNLLERLQQAIAVVMKGGSTAGKPRPRALAKRASQARKTANVKSKKPRSTRTSKR